MSTGSGTVRTKMQSSPNQQRLHGCVEPRFWRNEVEPVDDDWTGRDSIAGQPSSR